MVFGIFSRASHYEDIPYLASESAKLELQLDQALKMPVRDLGHEIDILRKKICFLKQSYELTGDLLTWDNIESCERRIEEKKQLQEVIKQDAGHQLHNLANQNRMLDLQRMETELSAMKEREGQLTYKFNAVEQQLKLKDKVIYDNDKLICENYKQ